MGLYLTLFNFQILGCFWLKKTPQLQVTETEKIASFSGNK